MISLGLHFSLKGGREAGLRLVFTALGVAAGVALLLFLLSGFNGLDAKDERQAWTYANISNHLPSVDESTSDPLWWRVVFDAYGARELLRVEVAATGANSPGFPGLDRLPVAGEYYVSPALADLLQRTPPDTLAARLPGRMVGLIGNAGLLHPGVLTAVVGRSISEMAAMPDSVEVRSIETAPLSRGYHTFFKIILGIGAVGLLLPVLVFIMTSTRFAAARREERFAALRLVGATPGQVGRIASIEAGLAAALGTAIGFACFYLCRPLVARIALTGEPFFTEDLSLGRLAVSAVAIGVPLAAVLAGLWALRRVSISPLGVVRRVTPKPPRPWRLVPLLVGLAALGLASVLPTGSGRTEVVVIVGTFAFIIVGLTIAGPWLTMVAARLLAKSARRECALIAGRRLADDPGSAFRAISGMVLAVFVGTVFVSIVGAAIGEGRDWKWDTLPEGAVCQSLAAGTFYEQYDREEPSNSSRLRPAEGERLLASLGTLQGVDHVIPLYEGDGEHRQNEALLSQEDWQRLGPAEMPPPPGDARDAVVSAPLDPLLRGYIEADWATPVTESVDDLAGRYLNGIIVLTDGAETSVERVRTVLLSELPQYLQPVSGLHLAAGAAESEGRSLIETLRRMVYVGILLSLLVAGCSLAVAVTGGLIERKRPFTLLRLSGMPLGRLRRVVMLEAAVPLLLVALVSVGAGFLAAELILRAAEVELSVAAPGASYWILMVGGLVAAMGVVSATLPLLSRTTRIQTARME